jgi:hypothetical protein
MLYPFLSFFFGKTTKGPYEEKGYRQTFTTSCGNFKKRRKRMEYNVSRLGEVAVPKSSIKKQMFK